MRQRAKISVEKRAEKSTFGCTGADIMESTTPESPVDEYQALLAGALELTPAAILIIDENQRILYFNRGAEKIFGYTVDEILGRSLNVMIPNRFRKGHRKHINEFSHSAFDYKFMTDRGEIIGLRSDGTEFPAVASISKYKIEEKFGFTVLIHDITATKNADKKVLVAKNEVELANRAQTEFLANISHELRTPLNAVIGFADILSSEMFGDLGHPKYLDYAKSISRSANHLLAVIKDILDTSKIDAGQMSLDEDTVDVRKLIHDCKNMVRVNADNSRVMLSSRVSNTVSSIIGDELRLKQILLNLLSNAIKFTKPQGRVSIRVLLDKHGAINIKVADTGIGIKPEDIPIVLQPFGQVNDIMTRPHQGTGLGLSIATAFAELHGAKLSIESKIDKGTTVTVTFPRERTVVSD